MPVDRQLVTSVLDSLSLEEFATPDDAFSVANDLCRIVGQDSEAPETHDVLLRALERRSTFGSAGVILDGLIRQVGLFPYLDPTRLSLADYLAYEAHRPEHMDSHLVFHRAQAHVYHQLMAGENVALSAPTSFGKSLIIDAAIASGQYQNIVIVVPTLALIDETRRRLTRRFSHDFKVITRPSQARAERNIFVLTQERVLEAEDWSFVDFFVIDEFYKLSPDREDTGRSALLNQAFYVLAKSGAQFYMLGPSIKGITEQNYLRIEIRFIHEPNYHTVATEVHRMRLEGDEYESLIELCRTLESPTIIFCRSPNRASEVARKLVAAGLAGESTRLDAACEWLAENYHEDWHFREALSRGIGVHHGRIPRSLAQFVVRGFNDGDIEFLACTSTLIEGVNTTARNIVVFDNTINQEQIDLFTFNNIKGRSGRMFQHFVGHVYVFHSDPQTELPFVDVPALSQSSDAPDSLIVQMDEDDLTDDSRRRRSQFVEQDTLTFAVIQENRGVDPMRQIAVADTIAQSSDTFKRQLAWNGVPRYEQLKQVCSLIWDHFDGRTLASGSVRSASQLTFMVWHLRDRPTTRELIDEHINNPKFPVEPDVAVTRVLDFVRLWATFHFPRLLRAINRIQRDVLGREGKSVGNYDYFAAQVESLFLDPVFQTFDEYGVPLEVARKLEQWIATNGDIDQAIERFKGIAIDEAGLSEFERELVEDAREHV